MRDRDSASKAWRSSTAPWDDIDLLLNNAGLAPPTDPMPDTDWERIET